MTIYTPLKITMQLQFEVDDLHKAILFGDDRAADGHAYFSFMKFLLFCLNFYMGKDAPVYGMQDKKTQAKAGEVTRSSRESLWMCWDSLILPTHHGELPLHRHYGTQANDENRQEYNFYDSHRALRI